MRTLMHFRNFVNEIMSSNSRLHKQAVLKKYADDEVIKKYLQIAFDPFKIFGIAAKKLHKEIGGHTGFLDDLVVFDLFAHLEKYNTGTTAEIVECQLALDFVASRDMECAELLEKLICKDLSIGVDVGTITKIMPGVCRTFSVQLAQKYFERPEKIEGLEFAITEKIDGGRIIAIKDNGRVEFYTRAGKLYDGLVDLEKELLEKFPDCVLDGEITIFNNKGVPSKLAYKQAMKLTRSDGPKTGLKMLVFDCMSVEEFRSQKCTHTWSERRETVEYIFNNMNTAYFELLPVLYRGTDTSVITKFLNDAIAKQQEGVMLSVCNARYEFTRTWALQKVKKMNDIDLAVIGFEGGSGRLTNTLGALLVRYKNNNVVRVGSGFSDEQRREIWENQSKYLGTICTVQYFETSTATTGPNAGQESLRFPVFCDFRFDKTKPDF